MKQHKSNMKENRFGGWSNRTLCGRSNRASSDGMNVAATDAEVTCKFCLKLMESAQ
jgi:hypothetical protein